MISSVKNISNLQLIAPYDFFPQEALSKDRLSVRDAAKLIEKLDVQNQYDIIILRGFALVEEIMHKRALQSKTIPYITDFKHEEKNSTAVERDALRAIYDYFPNMFLQTLETKQTFQTLIGVSGEKIQILYPMIPDYEIKRPIFSNRHNTLVYAGKFHEDWHTEEIIAAATVFKQEEVAIKFHIVGDKFQDRLRERDKQLRIKDQLEKNEVIHWHGAVTRDRAQEIIAQSDVGIAWRSESLDNDDSVELSSKLLEYGRLGKPVLLRKTKMHTALLGEDYPLFVDDEEDFLEKAMTVLSDERVYKKKFTYGLCSK